MSTVNKDKDIELWKAWKKSPSEQTLTPLLKQVEPLINKEVNRWSGAVSSVPLMIEAKKQAIEAFHTYDPKKGAGLGTHVSNRIQKISRLVYSKQNLARIPEQEQLRTNAYRNAERELESNLGRPPTIEELSEHMSWPGAAIKKVRKMIHTENIESVGSMPISGHTEDDTLLNYIYHDLAPHEQLLFEHVTGYGGTKKLSTPDMLKKLKMTQSQFSYAKKKLIDKVKLLKDIAGD